VEPAQAVDQVYGGDGQKRSGCEELRHRPQFLGRWSEDSPKQEQATEDGYNHAEEKTD